METPICDFIEAYAARDPVRMHMPGHKGAIFTGPEKFDITEITGADELYAADGIIRRSEQNASALFGSADTLYSTEGSSQCICAMLFLALLEWRRTHRTASVRPAVIAARNVHKAFVRSAALLDFDPIWLSPEDEVYSLTRCRVGCGQLERLLCETGERAAAVFITSPDYLGTLADIRALSESAHKYGVMLLVDNAHGAYLRFLPESLHSLDLGADMCCDSAHKTLPVLTGGAYLHISEIAPESLAENARYAMGMFGSTSPSYLILRSLDAANAYIDNAYSERLRRFIERTDELKRSLSAAEWVVCVSDPLRITLYTPPRGTDGLSLLAYLEENGVFCEYASPEHLVMMLTPENTEEELEKVKSLLISYEKRPPQIPPSFTLPEAERVMSVRDAALAPSETIPSADAAGRVLASPCVSCPPAVSCAVSGERLSAGHIRIMEHYGIKTVRVVCTADEMHG